METSSATTSIISTLGAGSGIDMQALATNLANAQFQTRTARLTANSEKLDRQISAASAIKSQLLQLSSALGDRVRSGDVSAQPQIANGSVATATKGLLTGSGSYSLEVTALANGQTLTTPPLASASTPAGSGTLTLRFGTIAGTAFTEDPAHAAVDITIASGATLADVAAAINGSGSGVSAYVANTTNGAQIVLKGAQGEANGFILEATEDPAEPGLSALAWTPAGDLTRRTANASNAAFRIDGLAMTSKSNAIPDVVPGVSLNLTGTNVGAPTRISFSDPAAAVTTLMNDLTTALNEIVTGLRDETDPLNGDLASDSGSRALRRTLTQLAGTIVMPNASGTEPRTLADLGLATQRDGSFRLDTARLNATMKADPAGAAAMFTNGIFGVFSTIDKMTRQATSAVDPGTIGGSIKRYTDKRIEMTDEIANLAEKQATLRSQLSARFAVSETRVGASRSTLTFIQNQIAAWNAPRT